MARGERRGSSEIYTGRLNERDTLGFFKTTPIYKTELEKISDPRTGYVERGKILNLIRRYPSEDPMNPTKPFAKELRMAVIEAMGYKDESDMDRVRFYTAVGTPADVFHGIDAWMEIESSNGRDCVLATLDVTKNPNKETGKADVIVQEITDPSEDEDAFLSQVETYAEKVVGVLRQQIHEKEVQVPLRRRV